jgi:hypothetical protein
MQDFLTGLVQRNMVFTIDTQNPKQIQIFIQHKTPNQSFGTLDFSVTILIGGSFVR